MSEQSESTSSSRSWMWLGVLAAVLIVTAGIYGLFLRDGGDTSELPPAEVQTQQAQETQLASIPSETPSIPTLIVQTDQAVTATSAAEQTQLALSWTPTPTDDIPGTIDALRTETVIAIMTETAAAWTPTPTPTPTPIPVGFAGNPVTSNEQWEPVIQEFDGVEMVLVPAGCFMMGNDPQAEYHNGTEWITGTPDGGEQCFEEPFWIDRYEVTDAQFSQFEGVAANLSNWTNSNFPRGHITWFEANNFCELRSARLPTEREWEYAARGPDNLTYPWGNNYDYNNVVSDANPISEVGSRPGGMAWVGAYDMSGNVWEWTSTIVQPYPYNSKDGRENNENTNSNRVTRGGSAGSSDFWARIASRNGTNPNLSTDSYGFRCARDYYDNAAPSPILTADALKTEEPTQEPPQEPTSDATELATEENPMTSVTANTQWQPVIQEFDGVEMALVPAGCFMMGSEIGQSDEQPVRQICLNAPFWIDRYEVTNAQFQQFEGTAAAASYRTSPDHPREMVTWFEARDFCALRGARLPTEAEWEYAASGPDNLEYPWGNDWNVANAIWGSQITHETARVGSIPAGSSWVGAYDMSGNVWEWVPRFSMRLR